MTGKEPSERSASTTGRTADLHVHSTASDGTLTPVELIERAHQLGIKTIALTDHDTCDGHAAAAAAARDMGIRFIPGVELSVMSHSGPVHLLGLGLFSINPELESLLSTIREGRRRRNPMIVRRLNILGYRITDGDVASFAQGQVIGRPHIAQALVAKGFFDSSAEAFRKLLRPGTPAYVHRFRPHIADASRVISGSGGIPVLAHPGLLDMDEREFTKFIGKLQKIGVRGIESNYTSYSEHQVEFFESLCKSIGLIPTAGSDFHGDNKSGAQLGKGSEQKWIPESYAAPLLSALNL